MYLWSTYVIFYIVVGTHVTSKKVTLEVSQTLYFGPQKEKFLSKNSCDSCFKTGETIRIKVSERDV